jgi:transglutaminase-like putative cysteine protease
MAAFAFVRDRVRFGFRGSFYALKASEVLEGGIGFCNNQSTLMVALLRAAGVPARAHFVDITAEVLGGVLSPGTPFVDHSWTEAYVDGRWRAVDAYIVDPPLMRAAKARLKRERRVLGYGAHVNGVTEWNGRDDAFSQFVNDGAHARLSTRDYGVFDDVGAFYAAKGERWNRMSPVVSLALLASVGGVNRKLDALRAAHGVAA